MPRTIGASELVLNPDGSVFHLHLKPGQIADDIILVGDPGRVRLIAEYFDETEPEVQNREFVTITGKYNGKRITVLSTGIGTDNIDIVLNELDALANIDLNNRTVKPDLKSLNFIRIGTSGALQADIPVFSFIASRKSMGFDNLMHFYHLPKDFSDDALIRSFTEHTKWNPYLASPYIVDCYPDLYSKIIDDRFIEGITISAPGFYGPQGRSLRLKNADPDLNSKIESFSYEEMRITNFEMESSAIYGLSKLMGHHAVTVCLIIANRMVNSFKADYTENMKSLIQHILHKLTR